MQKPGINYYATYPMVCMEIIFLFYIIVYYHKFLLWNYLVAARQK